MKSISIIFLFLILNFSNHEDIAGKYEFKGDRYFESIELLDNNTFIYTNKREFINYTLRGNYNIKGDNLVLDSSPQRDKIIVRERNKGKFENKIFNVTDKKGYPITFHLYLVQNDSSLKVIKNCFKKVKIKTQNIKSFYLVSTSGLKSPEYTIEENFTNVFDIQFETTRVFENENWRIDTLEQKIQPKGPDGEIQSYYLVKK